MSYQQDIVGGYFLAQPVLLRLIKFTTLSKEDMKI